MVEFPDSNWKDYELIDSGAGEKLERFGSYVLARPEPKALWDKSLPQGEWDRLSHTRFRPGAGFGKAGKEDSGTWERLHRMDDQWWIRYPLGGGSSAEDTAPSDFASLIPPSLRDLLSPCTPRGWGAYPPTPPVSAKAAGPSRLRDHGWSRSEGAVPSASLSLRLGLTSFKHVGVFPEQAPNWEFIYRKCREMEHPRVLNLFAYTGAASLAARAAGAEVTHLDSVRQVVTWARGNYERTLTTLTTSGGFGGYAPRPLGVQGDSSSLLRPSGIRWVVEDALKFARREARRGNTYDGIILDPPAYGHGPDGEKWKLDECLFEMLRTVAQILAPYGFVVLNLYSNGYSAALGETLVRQSFGLSDQSLLLSPCTPRGEGEDSPSAAHAAIPSVGASASGSNLASPMARISSGELALKDSFGKVLPLSIVVRLEK